MNQDTVYAHGTAIEASLKLLAERRTDIFGVGDEETAIGKLNTQNCYKRGHFDVIVL